MKLKDLIDFKNQGRDVVAELNKLYKEEMESEGYAGLEIGAVYDDAISYDSDFEMLLDTIGVKIVEIKYNVKELDLEEANYLYLYDGGLKVAVPFIDEENRHGEDLGDETFVFFNELIILSLDNINQ